MCDCEDRPACGCDTDVYQPYQPTPFEGGCNICHLEWNDDDDEDDEVQGFHSDCIEYE